VTSHDPLKAVLAEVSEGVFIADTEGRILAANKRLHDLLLLPAELLSSGDPVHKLTDFLRQRGEYRSEEEYQQINDLLRRAPVEPFQIERIHANDQCLEIRGKPMDDGGFIITFADATKRRAEALRQAEARLRDCLDVAGVIIVVLDARHRITFLNRKGCEVLGVEEKAIQGLNWFDTFAPKEERAQQKVVYANFLAGNVGPAQDIEMTVVTAKGDVRLVTWHDILLRDAQGQVVGGLSSGEDITEKRVAGRRRDELRTLIEATAQASPDGILVTDSTGRYLFWNDRLKEMWRLSDEFLRARRTGSGTSIEQLRPYVDLITDPRSFLEEIRHIYGEYREPLRKFAEVQLKDGRVVERYAASVSVGDPQFTAIAWIYRDISETKKRDRELALGQRLAAVGALSGGMAHELNNLLMVIGGHVELVQELVSPESKIAQLSETAIGAVRRGADLIQRVLAFARQQPLAPRLTEVNTLVADTLLLLPQLLSEQIKLSFRGGEELWKCVVDPGQLQTAIINLALNARDAMPEGGRLTIATANESLDRTRVEPLGDVQPGDYVVISVSDSGFGMPTDVAERAFEPFFTTKPVGQGTGLGLSMVFGFVKQSGGHVALESQVGRGTTIRIYLPRSIRVESALGASRPASSQASSRETVLVVEDEPGVSAVAQAFFSSLGYKVLDAPDGPQAVQILKAGDPIDILFTDVVLPEGMNGREIAEAARTLHPGIKVLFASGYTMDALMSQGQLEASANLLQKPYRRNDLVQALRRLA
jgi:PAS domain S-box-containing protein